MAMSNLGLYSGPADGFDEGVDVDKLRGCLRGYHNQQQIGIPAGVEGSESFVDVIAGRLDGGGDYPIWASYTTRSNAGPVMQGADSKTVVFVSANYTGVRSG